MVYVDDMNRKFSYMKMCHLVADTTEELLEMVDRIGVPRKWIQKQGTWQEHFDICLTKKELAVKAGAKKISYGRELGLILEQKRRRMGL